MAPPTRCVDFAYEGDDEEEEAATDSDDSDDGGNGASIASARRSAARVARSEPTAAAPQVYQAPPQ